VLRVGGSGGRGFRRFACSRVANTSQRLLDKECGDAPEIRWRPTPGGPLWPPDAQLRDDIASPREGAQIRDQSEVAQSVDPLSSSRSRLIRAAHPAVPCPCTYPCPGDDRLQPGLRLTTTGTLELNRRSPAPRAARPPMRQCTGSRDNRDSISETNSYVKPSCSPSSCTAFRPARRGQLPSGAERSPGTDTS